MINLASFSFKYDVDEYFLWAMEIIVSHCGPPKQYIKTCSIDDLIRLLRLATNSKMEVLKTIVVDQWLERLKDDEVALRRALDDAGEYGLHELQAKAYYEQMARVSKITPRKLGMPISFKSVGLGPVHTARLHRGFISLSLLAARIQRLLPVCTAFCIHPAHEVPSDLWKNNFLGPSLHSTPSRPFDILAWINSALHWLSTQRGPCVSIFERALRRERDAIESNLACHFLDELSFN